MRPFTNPAGMTTFAFTILPLVIIISALSAILWYWRVLPVIVGGMAFVLRRTLGIGGAVGLGSAATVFLGNIEGSLVVRPYLAKVTQTRWLGRFVSPVLLFIGGYGPLLCAITTAAYVKEIRRAQATWEKTEKTGQVAMPA